MVYTWVQGVEEVGVAPAGVGVTGWLVRGPLGSKGSKQR